MGAYLVAMKLVSRARNPLSNTIILRSVMGRIRRHEETCQICPPSVHVRIGSINCTGRHIVLVISGSAVREDITLCMCS